MNRRSRLAFAVLATVAALAAAPLASAGAAATNTGVPFTDPNAQGTLSICDKNGNAVTSGKITDVPFAWRVVSSSAAPKGYVGKFGKATLVVFQPRQNVNPGEWSGKQFTSSSWYTNPAHPMAQATYGDPALIDLVSIAPLWQGTLQLRLVYSNVNTVVHTRPYPAAVIRVTGSTWTLLTPNSTACNVGSATADETQLVPKQALPSASPTLKNPSGGTPTLQATPTTGDGSASATDPAANAGDGNVAASATSGSSGIPLGVVIALIALPAIGIGIGFFLARRGRPTGGGHARP